MISVEETQELNRDLKAQKKKLAREQRLAHKLISNVFPEVRPAVFLTPAVSL